jgi:hypothetical protein
VLLNLFEIEFFKLYFEQFDKHSSPLEFYELLLSGSDLSESEKIAYRESYRTFLIWSGDEYRQYDPNEYLLEE